MKIYFYVKGKGLRVEGRHKRRVLRAAKKTLRREGFLKASCNIIITNNRIIKRLNKKYRQTDAATDCLSFPQFKPKRALRFKKTHVFLGDIVLSFEKAAAQARKNGVSTDCELSLLTCHSVLHLLGYDHDTAGREKEMFGLQRKILNI